MTRCCMQHAGASRHKQAHALCMNVSFASVANSADTEKRHRERERKRGEGEPKDPNLMRINFHFHKRDRFLLQSAGIRDPAENLCHGQTMTNRSAWARESKRRRRRGRSVVVGRADFPLSRRQTMPQREVPRRGTDPLSLSPSLYPSLSHLENAPKQIVELLRKIELAKQQTKRSARVVIPQEEEATLRHGCEGYLPCLSTFLLSSLSPSLSDCPFKTK